MIHTSLWQRTRRLARRYFALAMAMVAAVGMLWANPAFYEPAAAELIALVAVLMAGILPTAILSATVIKAGGFSVHRIMLAREALLKQMNVWAGLFLYSGIAGALLTVGKLLKWSWVLPLARLGASDFDLGRLLNSIVTFCLMLVLLRTMTIFTGLRSLIVLSADIAQSEAVQRDRPTFDRGMNAIETMDPRPGFGDQVDLPR